MTSKEAQIKALQAKYDNTIKRVQELQELEKYMFKNLQDLNSDNSQSNSAQKQMIKRQCRTQTSFGTQGDINEACSGVGIKAVVISVNLTLLCAPYTELESHVVLRFTSTKYEVLEDTMVAEPRAIVIILIW